MPGAPGAAPCGMGRVAMEYVRVTFPTDRFVYVNGERSGRTNEVMRIATGTHAFNLGPYSNYEPDHRVLEVQGTSVLQPAIIPFTRKARA